MHPLPSPRAAKIEEHLPHRSAFRLYRVLVGPCIPSELPSAPLIRDSGNSDEPVQEHLHTRTMLYPCRNKVLRVCSELTINCTGAART